MDTTTRMASDAVSDSHKSLYPWSNVWNNKTLHFPFLSMQILNDCPCFQRVHW